MGQKKEGRYVRPGCHSRNFLLLRLEGKFYPPCRFTGSSRSSLSRFIAFFPVRLFAFPASAILFLRSFA
jgi:hypothetical protein